MNAVVVTRDARRVVVQVRDIHPDEVMLESATDDHVLLVIEGVMGITGVSEMRVELELRYDAYAHLRLLLCGREDW